MDNQQQLMNWW